MKFRFISKDKIRLIPKTTGVYAFKKGREFLYIGKAANIRERVKNHFQRPRSLWEQTLLRQGFGGRVGYIITNSEIEALLLEANLIKKYQPKFNVMWRDDKNYFYIGITKEPFSRIFMTHQPKIEVRSMKYEEKKKQIFRSSDFRIQTSFVGPFVDGKALKQALQTLRKVFPYRSCKNLPKKPCPPKFLEKSTKITKSTESQKLGRACLWYQLSRCPAPCLLKTKLAEQIPSAKDRAKKEYQKNIKNLITILQGKRKQVLKTLKVDMKSAAREQNFEMAAKIRDRIKALEKVLNHAKIFEQQSEIPKKWQDIEKELKMMLKTQKTISRIEAYDISNIQGFQSAGSMVAFVKGKADKSLYRKFKIRAPEKPNDVAAIKEVLERRFSHPEWPFPDLILIDGGIGQLSAALKIKKQISKIKKKIIFLSLAKKENKLFIEGRKKPIFLKALSREIFNLILQLRDEAHRFARAYHHKLKKIKLLT